MYDSVTPRAMQGAEMAPLTTEQKKRLILLERTAFNRARGTATDFEAWRRVEQFKACGKAYLTASVNGDYKKLRAHFLLLAGYSRAAAREYIAAQSEPRQWAMAKLQQECRAAADVLPAAMSYARGFLMNKRGLDLDDCPAKDLWHAVYLIRRRAHQLRRKRKAVGI